MFQVLRIVLLAVAAHGFGIYNLPTPAPTEPKLPTTTDGVDDDPTRAPAAIPNPALPTARPTDAPQKTDALTGSSAPTKGVVSAPTRSPTSTPCQLAITGVGAAGVCVAGAPCAFAWDYPGPADACRNLTATILETAAATVQGIDNFGRGAQLVPGDLAAAAYALELS